MPLLQSGVKSFWEAAVRVGKIKAAVRAAFSKVMINRCENALIAGIWLRWLEFI